MLSYKRREAIFDHGSSWSAENVTNKKNAHLSFTENSMVTRALGLRT
jgi:hypothetical protein